MNITVMDGHGWEQGRTPGAGSVMNGPFKFVRKGIGKAIGKKGGKGLMKKEGGKPRSANQQMAKRRIAESKAIAAQKMKAAAGGGIKEAQQLNKAQPKMYTEKMNRGGQKGFSQAVPTSGAAAGRAVNGFSYVYAESDVPGSNALNGFSRIQTTWTEIMQGYQLGDAQDLREWEILCNLEHPTVLNGFPNFILQGKAERQARKQRRAADKSRKERRKEAKTAKKEARTAKKEEKVLRKEMKREQKALDKAARRDRKAEKIASRERIKLAREERKAETGPQIAEAFSNIGEGAAEIFSNIVGNGSGFADAEGYTASDLPFIPDELGDTIDELRSIPAEDTLDAVSEFESEEPSNFERRSGRGSEGSSGGGGGMMAIGLLALLGLAAAGGGRKKKKKK